MKSQSNRPVKAITDIANALAAVFQKYTLPTRKSAWHKITSPVGEKEIKKIIKNPKRNIDTLFRPISLKEWIANQKTFDKD